MSIRNLAPSHSSQALRELGLLGCSRNYTKNTQLFTAESVLNRVYIVEKGLVTLTTRTDKGMLITGYRQPGDIIGAEDFLLGEAQPCGMTAVCRTHCTLIDIPFDTLHKTANTERLSLLGRAAASAAKNATRHATELAMTEIKERLKGALKTIAALPTSITHPKGIKIAHTRQEIAMAVNSSRETVGRLVKMLEDEGAVSLEGYCIIVHAEKPVYRRS